MTSNISSHYNLSAAYVDGTVNTIEEAKVVFLLEKHQNKSNILFNEYIINTYGKEQDTIFLEENPNIKPLEKKSIPHIIHTNFHIESWDDPETCETKTAYMNAAKKTIKLSGDLFDPATIITEEFAIKAFMLTISTIPKRHKHLINKINAVFPKIDPKNESKIESEHPRKVFVIMGSDHLDPSMKDVLANTQANLLKQGLSRHNYIILNSARLKS